MVLLRNRRTSAARRPSLSFGSVALRRRLPPGLPSLVAALRCHVDVTTAVQGVGDASQRVVLGALTDRGDAQAEIVTQREDGEQQTRVLHVPAGLPGEEVTIGVQEFANIPPRRHRRRWKPRPPRVWIEQVHTASELRVEPRCPVFGECGGCQLQHMSYAA